VVDRARFDYISLFVAKIYLNSYQDFTEMNPNTQYPKKGQYGSPTGRCQWCGKEESYFWGMYCSRNCAAAGSFYGFSFATIISIAFTIWSLVAFNLIGIIFFGIISIVFLHSLRAGYRMRKK